MYSGGGVHERGKRALHRRSRDYLSCNYGINSDILDIYIETMWYIQNLVQYNNKETGNNNSIDYIT